MLALLTLVVISALNIGTSNFRAVSNTQFRDEAVAAADLAIQQVVSSDFTASPAAEEIAVDINDDGTTDYVVAIAVPACIYAAVAEAADPSSVSLPAAMTVASTWNTVWEIDATVTAAQNPGQAAVRIRSGVRVLLEQAEVDTVCT